MDNISAVIEGIDDGGTVVVVLSWGMRVIPPDREDWQSDKAIIRHHRTTIDPDNLMDIVRTLTEWNPNVVRIRVDMAV